ncbi:NAD(P)/FAD-dependent oxidoreductase [Qingshengfaniella alkalisoli]|uniref:FAD-dependent oxidoreductase n=1 Tax=Qingshengfaniella alkalisoli TaxID=2599296 RepID=A0A5B8IXN4_9RHOB|nr:FAD-dependent oxidoreductase [Qingshengfaniella alkalisoli]QDY70494.1 FAD-dependent oxidoreductase [Qingshengfaniella alkalisoli]
MAQNAQPEIVVIGAGVIGVTTALALQSGGHQVCLLDRSGVAAETSRGNAGAFAYTDIEPLATPGIMRKAPKWLLDPLGPLSVPPAYALNIAPWMLRFWRASWPDRYAAAVEAQANMMKLSRAALERLIPSVSGEALIRREGQLQLYEGDRQFRASLPAWEKRRDHGIAFQLLESPAAIADIQPGLHSRFTHAGFTPDWMNTVDPERWTKHLAHAFVARGGQIETANVQALQTTETGTGVVTERGVLHPLQIVVCAGAWSHHLARTIGDHFPLETERGYNTTFPTASFDLRTHLTFSGHGFVVSKIGEGLRVGGAVELGGLKLPPNFKRAETLVQKAAQFLPGFDPEGGTQWMGFRPSLPDSLPVIGRSPKVKDVIYAFGHNHLGLTQSAGTAELVNAIASRQDPEIPLRPYRANRF